MIDRPSTVEDADWWLPHAMLGAFAVLVAAILRLLFGWSAPLHAWIVLAGLAMATLAVHATWRAARCARLRQWPRAALASLLGVALGMGAIAMLGAGRSHRSVDGVLIDAPLDRRDAAR